MQGFSGMLRKRPGAMPGNVTRQIWEREERLQNGLPLAMPMLAAARVDGSLEAALASARAVGVVLDGDEVVAAVSRLSVLMRGAR